VVSCMRQTLARPTVIFHRFSGMRSSFSSEICNSANTVDEILPYDIHRVTVAFHSISMPAGFRRHLVGKTLTNVCYSAVIEIRFVGRLMVMLTFS